MDTKFIAEQIRLSIYLWWFDTRGSGTHVMADWFQGASAHMLKTRTHSHGHELFSSAAEAKRR